MLNELFLVMMLAQMAFLGALMRKIVQLESKQTTAIYGISHVWGILNESALADKPESLLTQSDEEE